MEDENIVDQTRRLLHFDDIPYMVYKPRSKGITDMCVREGDTCARPTSTMKDSHNEG